MDRTRDSTWRFLIDEDTDPRTATALRDREFDAVAVQDSVGKGTPDPEVRAFAERTSRVLVTTDRGFQRAERHRGIRVLMVPDDLDGAEIADRITELVGYVEVPEDLPRVQWLSRE